MEQMQKLLARLSAGQKTSLVAVALLVVAGITGLTRWRHEADFRPLYTGLSAEDAGPVVEKLKQSGTEYRLSENGATVLAPSEKVPELRLQMAASGLPKSGRIGFELFDKTNFGMTDFAEHVNYRRALEGELERSIASLAEVEQARVHLTFPKDSVYLEDRQPAKASVVLGLHPGARLSPQNVMAVCNLVASAVEGLAPEAVSVIDTRGDLLHRPRRSAPGSGLDESEGNLEYREMVEKSLVAKIQATLDPLLGAERFRATVTADCDFSSGQQSEESYDPSHSVMVSSHKSEEIAPAAYAGGVPGTASNLPHPPARTAGVLSGGSRRSEEIDYQSSRTVRQTKIPQGEVKRLSVALLIDQDVRWEGRAPHLQRVLTPPSADKLKAIHDLVAGAINFNAARGDQLIVETLPFEATLDSEPPEAEPAPAPAGPRSPIPAWLRTPKGMAAVGGGVLLLLVLAGLALRRQGRHASASAAAPAALPAGEARAPAPAVAGGGAGQALAQLEDPAESQARLEAEVLNAIKGPSQSTNKKEVLIRYLREGLKQDQIAPVQTLRTWLHEKS